MVRYYDLKTLNDFLVSRDVDYVLTGTMALYVHGALPSNYEVKDLDIIALTTDENRDALMSMFGELEKLSGCQYCDEHYTHRVYIFKIGQYNIKVNVFEGKPENTPSSQMFIPEIGMMIRVHDVSAILEAKFSLSRPKDYMFFHKYIAWLSGMSLESKNV